MRSHPLVLALLFSLACLFLLGGRVAQARPAPADPGPLDGLLEITPGDPAAGPAGPAALVLETTVGLDPNCIGATDAITVPAGTAVTFCYHLVNNTGYTLTTHNLHDLLAENILNDAVSVLAPNATANVKRTVVVTGTLDNLATWSVTQPITGYATGSLVCGSYPDASGGQALHLVDDGIVNLTLPFDFPFYDRMSNRLRVSNNGALLFDEPNAAVGFGNTTLPTAGLPHGLAAFWDDLDDDTGEIYAGMVSIPVSGLTAEAGSEAARPGADPQGSLNAFVVEYRNRSVFAGPSNPGSFAVLLFAPGQGNDGYLAVCYKDTFFDRPAQHDFGVSATLGVNHNAGTATLFSYNTVHAELTGTFGLTYTPIGPHRAFVARDAARVNAVTRINLPLISR